MAAAWLGLAAGVTALVLAVAIRFAPEGASIEPNVLIEIRRFASSPSEATHVLLLAMLAATFIGSAPVLSLLVLASSVALWSRHRTGEATRLFFAAFAGMAIVNGAKLLFGRPRPEVVAHWTSIDSSSFPSGHSADAAIVFLLLAASLPKALGAGRYRRLADALALSLIFGVGISRLCLGVHWPSDVLGGWGFGAGWVCGTLAVYNARLEAA